MVMRVAKKKKKEKEKKKRKQREGETKTGRKRKQMRERRKAGQSSPTRGETNTSIGTGTERRGTEIKCLSLVCWLPAPHPCLATDFRQSASRVCVCVFSLSVSRSV